MDGERGENIEWIDQETKSMLMRILVPELEPMPKPTLMRPPPGLALAAARPKLTPAPLMASFPKESRRSEDLLLLQSLDVNRVADLLRQAVQRQEEAKGTLGPNDPEV
jgi:hypothetical protein